MQFSILHISDLHRDLKAELANGPLLDSLIWDIERYKKHTPPITHPSLCIVSGDLIYGVGPSHPDPVLELNRQYTQAVQFLISLADACFEGNRERIVLVPGNHDVSYPTVIASCTRIDVPSSRADKRTLTDELWEPNSKLRWSWAELCFYRIHLQRFAEVTHLCSSEVNLARNGTASSHAVGVEACFRTSVEGEARCGKSIDNAVSSRAVVAVSFCF
jgi:hypothetical protein